MPWVTTDCLSEADDALSEQRQRLALKVDDGASLHANPGAVGALISQHEVTTLRLNDGMKPRGHLAAHHKFTARIPTDLNIT